jgi:sodium-dependent phosphate transporter
MKNNWYLSEYSWILYCGIIAAFFFGFGMGSNDLSTSFSTSIGSKSLSIKQVVFLAIVFQSLGGAFLGQVTTAVLSSAITNTTSFENDPELYALGLLCALIMGSFFQIISTFQGKYVSPVQTMIGSIIGFSLVYEGEKSVQWVENLSYTNYKGTIAIMINWIVSPLFSSILCGINFLFCKLLILHKQYSYNRIILLLSTTIYLTTSLNTYFLLTTGVLMNNFKSIKKSKILTITFVFSSFITLCFLLINITYTKLNNKVKVIELPKKSIIFEQKDIEENTIEESKSIEMFDDKTTVSIEIIDSVETLVTNKDDIEKNNEQIDKINNEEVNTNDELITKHLIINTKNLTINGIEYKEEENINEKFDNNIENAFSYLQIYSSICLMFAYGACSIGFILGPLNGIFNVIKKGTIDDSVYIEQTPILLAFCCLSLICGLLFHGKHMIDSTNEKMSGITASRGFVVEISSFYIIMISTQIGLPSSPSQCVIFALLGLGVVEGRKNLKFGTILGLLFSWVYTFIISCLLTAGLFSFTIYSPKK